MKKLLTFLTAAMFLGETVFGSVVSIPPKKDPTGSYREQTVQQCGVNLIKQKFVVYGKEHYVFREFDTDCDGFGNQINLHVYKKISLKRFTRPKFPLFYLLDVDRDYRYETIFYDSKMDGWNGNEIQIDDKGKFK